MPQNFTGSDSWVVTCNGPANDDDATGDSVSDMGVQLANRTTWLAARHDDAYAWRLLHETTVADSSSAYGIVDDITADTWDPFPQFSEIVIMPHDPIDIRVELQGTFEVTLADWAELRLRAVKGAVDVRSPHYRIEQPGASKYVSAGLTLQGHDLSATDLTISLEGRLSTATGALNIRGGAKFVVYGLTQIKVPT